MDSKKYYVHESSYVDEDVQIGEGTKVWHFCHVQRGAVIGSNCSLGQNVNGAVTGLRRVGDSLLFKNKVKIKKCIISTQIAAGLFFVIRHTFFRQFLKYGAGRLRVSSFFLYICSRISSN